MNKYLLEQILKELKERVYRIDDSLTLSTRDVVNEEDIEEVITFHMNDGWVSVEDHLPNEINIVVPCFVEMKHIEGKSSFRTMIDWNDGCWKWSNGKKLSDKYEVLAWQKIKYPEPYKKL